MRQEKVCTSRKQRALTFSEQNVEVDALREKVFYCIPPPVHTNCKIPDVPVAANGCPVQIPKATKDKILFI